MKKIQAGKELRQAIRLLEQALNYNPQNRQAEQQLRLLRDQLEKIVKKPFDEGVAAYRRGSIWKLCANGGRPSISTPTFCRPGSTSPIRRTRCAVAPCRTSRWGMPVTSAGRMPTCWRRSGTIKRP
jgi:hypothetical protein